jgi:hypothetical protein
MQRHLVRLIKLEFEKWIQMHAAVFKSNRTVRMPAHWSLYEYDVAPNLSLYLVLAIASRDDRFTVELAWSARKTFPQSTGFGPNDRPTDAGVQFRLSALWDQQDHWWSLSADKSDVVEKASDAGSKILLFGYPYFRRVASEHRCEVPGLNP